MQYYVSTPFGSVWLGRNGSGRLNRIGSVKLFILVVLATPSEMWGRESWIERQRSGKIGALSVGTPIQDGEVA